MICMAISLLDTGLTVSSAVPYLPLLKSASPHTNQLEERALINRGDLQDRFVCYLQFFTARRSAPDV